MKVMQRLSPVERAAKALLEEKGYAVVPMIPCFITRHKPVHLMGLKDKTELVYIKLKEASRPLAGMHATEQFCHNDALLLRRLFPLRSKTTILHLEIWIRNKSGMFYRYEVLADGLREVSHV
jgi:hypothetical protein